MTKKIIEGTFAPIEIKDGREIIKADKKYIKWDGRYFIIPMQQYVTLSHQTGLPENISLTM